MCMYMGAHLHAIMVGLVKLKNRYLEVKILGQRVGKLKNYICIADYSSKTHIDSHQIFYECAFYHIVTGTECYQFLI